MLENTWIAVEKRLLESGFVIGDIEQAKGLAAHMHQLRINRFQEVQLAGLFECGFECMPVDEALFEGCV